MTVSSSDSNPEHDFVEAVYVQDEWVLSPQLTLNAGLRFDAYQAHYSDAQPGYDQFEPRIGISYLITPSTKLHAYYGRLFNAPPFENLHETFTQLQTGQIGAFDIKPEKDNYYEAGVEQQIGGHQFASATVYYKDATDLLDDAQLLNTSLSQPFNWSHGYAYGLELAVHGEVSRDWSDFFNYAYGLAKGKGISGGLFAFGAGDPATSGGYQYLDHVQLHTASAGTTYSHGGFWWTGQGLYGSGLRTGPQNTASVPGHFSWNTTLGYEFSNFKLALDVINIFDNRYAISVANGFNGSYYAAGRELFGHVSREF